MTATNKDEKAMLSQQLLLSVAEELKMPLQQIARMAELGKYNGESELSRIQSTADNALRLLDNYSLGVRLALNNHQLSTESVSVASVLYDSSHQLDGLAKLYGVDLQIEVNGKLSPVLANRHALQAAIVSIGAALIEAMPSHGDKQLSLNFATHRSRYGIVAGIYTPVQKLSNSTLLAGKKLQSISRQPFINLSHTSAAGIFVADSILKGMDLKLISSRHHHLYGLGTVLQPTHQLQLI